MDNSKKSNRSDESSSARGNTDSSSKSSRKGKRQTLRVTSFPQSLPPEVAAQYLSQATAAAAAAWEKSSSNSSSSANQESSSRSGSNNRPYGPSRPPPSGSSVSFGSLDLAALAQSGSLDFATAAAAASRSSSGEKGPPCSEAEMKALMSMFVEIMGMSMDSDNSGSSKRAPRPMSGSQGAKSFVASGSSSGDGGSYHPVFMFGESGSSEGSSPPGGWSSGAAAAAMAAAAGVNREFSNYYEDSDVDDDSIPDLDESPLSATGKQTAGEKDAPTKDDSNRDGDTDNLSPDALTAIEQVELDDALQEEERARKAEKKRERKKRQKEKQKKEKELKALQAAQKKREKLVLSWRSRVVTACQSNEVSKLETLLGESPLRPPKTHDESEEETQAFIKTHMEYLLPNCIAKSRQVVEEGREARQTLTNFILNWSVQLGFSCRRNGRAAIHTACFNGDSYFAKLLLQRAASAMKEDSSVLPESYRSTECQDSGWAPLHYAVVSGSSEIVEVLLKEGCDLQKATDESKTWRISNGQGITARELAEIVRAGKHDKTLESHGDALSDMTEAHLDNSNERRRFQRVLEKVIERMIDVEQNGYTPLPNEAPDTETASEEKSDAKIPSKSSSSEDLSKNKKKKKKKEKKNQAEIEQAKKPPPSNAPPQIKEAEDPMISALLGMGFSSEQISAAVKALGGVERATPDDVVMWIFAQESGEPVPAPPAPDEDSDGKQKADEVEEVPFTDPNAPLEKKKKAQEQREQAAAIAQQNLLEASKREEEARIAAQKLAAKREEQRRRNREWNNREQARQREEAQAKLTQEMERRARAEAQRAAMSRMAATQPAKVVTHNVGVPQQAAYAPAAGPSVLPAASEKSPSVQQQPMGTPTHLLQSNGKIRPVGSFVPGVTQYPMHTPRPQSSPPSNQMGVAPVPGMRMAMPVMSNAPPGYSGSFAQAQQTRPAMRAEMQRAPNHESHSYEYSQMGGEAYADPQLSMIPPEDGTVSSAGSGRPPRDIRVNMAPATHNGPPGMSLSSSTPPPGFRPSASAPNTPTRHEVVEEDNPLGEIRATAKAFVPTNFKPAPSQNVKVASAPSPSPAAFLRPSPGVSRSASDLGAHGYGGQASDDAVSSLLGGFGGLSSGSPSLLPSASARVSSAMDQSPAASAASSVAGAPAGSSLLEPVSLGTSSSVGDIWGTSGTANAGAPGAAVGGLPSFGVNDPTSSIGSIHTARSLGTLDNIFNDPSKENGGGSGNWGTGGNLGGTNPNGMGSIW